MRSPLFFFVCDFPITPSGACLFASRVRNLLVKFRHHDIRCMSFRVTGREFARQIPPSRYPVHVFFLPVMPFVRGTSHHAGIKHDKEIPQGQTPSGDSSFCRPEASHCVFFPTCSRTSCRPLRRFLWRELARGGRLGRKQGHCRHWSRR